MRIFFALWPPAETAVALARWSGEARASAGGRPVEAAKIHLTLAFLGDADAQRAVAAARRVSGAIHDLPLERARYWRESGVVWAGPSETPPALAALAESLRRELGRERFVLERRAFAAHVTLMRKARPAPLPPLPPALGWPVREFLLVRSSLSSAGSAYEPLESFPLAGPGSPA
jgi:2'-5' RNA ligase